MVTMHMVRGCTMDHHPVAAVVSTRTMETVHHMDFKARPVILLKVLPAPMIISGEAIGMEGEEGAHLHHDNLRCHHCLLRTRLRGRSSSTQQMWRESHPCCPRLRLTRLGLWRQ